LDSRLRASELRKSCAGFVCADEVLVLALDGSLELSLREVGLVTSRKNGRQIMYRTNAEALRTVHDWAQLFAQYWRGQLRRIKAHAEEKR